MDLVTFFLRQHTAVHASDVGGASLVERVFGELSDEQLRTRPGPRLNSLVWLLWHMLRRGYNQVYGTTTWKPKERFNGAAGWPWPNDPPKSAWTWVRTAGAGDRHYYDAVCEP